MDSAPGDANIEHKERPIEATIKGVQEHDLPNNKPKNEKEASCSSSTSSDGSSEEDFFQLDASELNRVVASSETPSAQHGGSAQLASEYGIRNGEVMLENDALIFGPQLLVGRSTSLGVFSGSSPGSDISTLGTSRSPPVQSMTRSDVPDPNRIPASVFARSKSTTPLEWSVASNESLFSIHMGNSSFSRDHVMLLNRSGELGVTPPISPFTSPSPPNTDIGQELAQPTVAEAANAEAMKDVLRAAAEEHADRNKPSAESSVLSSSISHRSDGSVSSFRSFAFPILTGEGRSVSVKVEPEPQHSEQPQKPSAHTETPKAAPAAGKSKWFPCFSCCSFC